MPMSPNADSLLIQNGYGLSVAHKELFQIQSLFKQNVLYHAHAGCSDMHL